MSRFFGIIRLEKCKSTAVSAMEYHNDRLPGEHSNKDIDPSRTHLNRELIAHGRYADEIAARIAAGRRAKSKVRKDAIVLVEGIMTTTDGFFEGKSQEFVDKWIADCFEFAKAEFGEENIFHFTVHFDETTLHIHFGFVPVKDGHLAWKKFINGQRDLSALQDRFFEKISKPRGLLRGEQRKPGGPVKRHKSVAESKAAHLRALDAEIAEKSERLECLQGEIEGAGQEVASREAQVERIKEERRGLAGEQCFEEGRARGLEVAIEQLRAQIRQVAQELAEAARAALAAIRGAREGDLGALAFERFASFFAPAALEGPQEASRDEIIGLNELAGLKAAESDHTALERGSHGHVADYLSR